ncbi:MAG: hypothetical protein ACLP9L_42245 [Thermoguttaceae bacterium]
MRFQRRKFGQTFQAVCGLCYQEAAVPKEPPQFSTAANIVVGDKQYGVHRRLRSFDPKQCQSIRAASFPRMDRSPSPVASCKSRAKLRRKRSFGGTVGPED